MLGFNFLNAYSFTNPFAGNYLNNYYPVMPQWDVYRPSYQMPVFQPFPNYQVSDLRSFSQLPQWNYTPQPIYMTPYSYNNYNNQSYLNNFSNTNIPEIEYPQPSVSIEEIVKELREKLNNQNPNKKNATSQTTQNSIATARLLNTQNLVQSNTQKTENVSFTVSKGTKTTKALDMTFVNRVKEIASKVKCDYRDLLGVMNSESGLNPTARNKDSGAIGLIQFTDIAIKDLNNVYGLNLTKEKIAKMSAMEQLDLVEKYLLRSKSFKFNASKQLDSADLYAIVYRPAFAGKEVIANRNDGNTYSQNKGLDLNKDGVISRQDLAQVVQNKRINVNLVA